MLNGAQFYGASDIIRMPHTPVRGQILANLVAGLAGPPLEERSATRSDLRGFRGETSSGRYILISFDLLKRLNGALAMTVLGPPTLEELSHTTNYLSVRQNQSLAWSSDSNLWGN